MKKQSLLMLALAAAFVVLMSLPFLVNGTGWLALFGFVPLLCMERVAAENKVRHFWWWHYGTFVAWNFATTFWVCNATVGGGIFAALANALQMSLVFGLFRWAKRRTDGVVPYLFLAAAWIAWEKYYLTVAQISWPWLVLGNAFAHPEKPFPALPIGKCRNAHCYNGHALLSAGLIPEMDTPGYGDLRDRVTTDGGNWLQPGLKDFFNTKLADSNETLGPVARLGCRLLWHPRKLVRKFGNKLKKGQ
jgi:hypothetical protein